jgi:hypothetical protein
MVLSAPPARGERHRVDHKCPAVFTAQVNDTNDATAGAPALYKPFAVAGLPWKAVPGVANHRFNLSYRTSVFRRMIPIPFYPTETFWGHGYLI